MFFQTKNTNIFPQLIYSKSPITNRICPVGHIIPFFSSLMFCYMDMLDNKTFDILLYSTVKIFLRLLLCSKLTTRFYYNPLQGVLYKDKRSRRHRVLFEFGVHPV